MWLGAKVIFFFKHLMALTFTLNDIIVITARLASGTSYGKLLECQGKNVCFEFDVC